MEATFSDPWYSVKYNVGYMRHCHLCRGEFTVGLGEFQMTYIGGIGAVPPHRRAISPSERNEYLHRGKSHSLLLQNLY